MADSASISGAPVGGPAAGSGLAETTVLPVIEDAIPEAFRVRAADERPVGADSAWAAGSGLAGSEAAATTVLPAFRDLLGMPAAPAPTEVRPEIHGPASIGAGLRGRILAVEGGCLPGRRGWNRGTGQAPVLSAMLAAVAPQTLLAADAVDAVHLPSASDPQTVLAHLRAAARHPGPLLVHLGGQLVADRRGGGLHLSLRDSKPGAARQDALAWQAVVAELSARPADRETLVIADLSADQSVWPLLLAEPAQLVDGLPLWAVVSQDAEQIGMFTHALIEALHGGRPGAGPLLTPEQLRPQVHAVLRPDMLVFASHGPDRPVFRNTARQWAGEQRPVEEQGPADPPPVFAAEAFVEQAVVDEAVVDEGEVADRAPVTLHKPGVPPTPPRPPRPVALAKPAAPESDAPEPAAPDLSEPTAVAPDLSEPAAVEPELAEPTAVEPELAEPTATEPAAEPPADYREAIGRIVRSAEGGEHAVAAELAAELEQEALAVHGSIAAPVLMIRQVRAHLARLAGDPAGAAELYREVALVLLAARGPEDPEAQLVATNAEACWRAIADPRVALRVAPEILELRAHLPGPDGRKLRAAERYLARLTAAAEAPAEAE